MKRHIFALLATAALFLCLTISASAAENVPDVTIQLDGSPIQLTDAVPQAAEGRTYLPFRALFEAMGAEVDYEGDVITAVRGGTTVTMTVGETTAAVDRSGEAETLEMDAAPYVDPAVWRTYVPVRFAADAFGCNVGWDQAARTVVLVDVETLAERAVEGRTFRLLEQLADYSARYAEGNWACSGTLSGRIGLYGAADAVRLDGTITGALSGSDAFDISAELKADSSGLLQAGTGAAAGEPREDWTDGSLRWELRGDLADGSFYWNPGALAAALGLPDGAWVCMPRDSQAAQPGPGWSSIDLAVAREGAGALLRTLAAGVPLDGRSADGYAETAGLLEALAAGLSDQGFTQSGTAYTSELSLELAGVPVAVTLTADTNRAGNLTGCGVELSFTEDLGAAIVGGVTADTATFHMSEELAGNTQSARYSAAVDDLYSVELDVDMTLKATSRAPAVAPPDGAAVVSLEELAARAAR